MAIHLLLNLFDLQLVQIELHLLPVLYSRYISIATSKVPRLFADVLTKLQCKCGWLSYSILAKHLNINGHHRSCIRRKQREEVARCLAGPAIEG